MIHTIIFSFNRAMQLNTLLESVRRYWKVPGKISVLYNFKGDEYGKGYEILKKNFPEIDFYKEGKAQKEYFLRNLFSFRNLKQWAGHKYIRTPKSNFHSLLRQICRDSQEPLTMFLTDDSIFTEEVFLPGSIQDMILEKPFQRSYSLRLGENMDGPVPAFSEKEQLYFWNYNNRNLGKNWKYHFSVDGHIYATSFIRKINDSVLFCNPNTFEPNSCAYARDHQYLADGIAGAKSKMLSFPLNMVQDIHLNESSGVSVAMLNQYFLDGWTLCLPLPEHPVAFQQYPDTISLSKDGLIKQIKIKG